MQTRGRRVDGIQYAWYLCYCDEVCCVRRFRFTGSGVSGAGTNSKEANSDFRLLAIFHLALLRYSRDLPVHLHHLEHVAALSESCFVFL